MVTNMAKKVLLKNDVHYILSVKIHAKMLSVYMTLPYAKKRGRWYDFYFFRNSVCYSVILSDVFETLCFSRSPIQEIMQ